MGCPNKSARFEVHALSSPWLWWVVGDICLILCPTINRSLCNLYWNKNISTVGINGVFITKLNIVLLLGHPIGLSVDKWMCPVKLNNFVYWPYCQAVRSATHLSTYKWRILCTELCVQSTVLLLAAASSDPGRPNQRYLYCGNTDCCCERHLAPSEC